MTFIVSLLQHIDTGCASAVVCYYSVLIHVCASAMVCYYSVLIQVCASAVVFHITHLCGVLRDNSPRGPPGGLWQHAFSSVNCVNLDKLFLPFLCPGLLTCKAGTVV